MDLNKLYEHVCSLDRQPFPPSVSVPSEFLRKMMNIINLWDYYHTFKDRGDSSNDLYAKQTADEAKEALEEFRQSYCEWDLKED